MWCCSGSINLFSGEMCLFIPVLVVSSSSLIFRLSSSSLSLSLTLSLCVCVCVCVCVSPSRDAVYKNLLQRVSCPLFPYMVISVAAPPLLMLWARRVHRPPPLTVRFHIWKWVQPKSRGGEGGREEGVRRGGEQGRGGEEGGGMAESLLPSWKPLSHRPTAECRLKTAAQQF